jgi:DNA-binding response OmpR family regulator
MQIFLGRALQGLGFMSYECSHVADLRATVDSFRPDLILIGVSGGGIEACEMIELLAAQQFRGKVLVLGPRLSPMVGAVRGLGQKLGLRVLPLLSTPFGAGDVRDRLPE